MKHVWPLFLMLFCSFSIGKKQENYNAARLYSVRELREDLNYLRNRYERHNPNLYLYTSPEKFDRYFDSLSEHITAPMTDMEFYRYIGSLTSFIKDGHTSVFPNDDCEWWYGDQEKFLPLLVTCNGDRIISDLNASDDRVIPDGSEIISINSRSSADILRIMRSYAPRDGYNTTRVNWILNNFFTYFYCYCVEDTSRFNITYITPDGKLMQHSQKAMAVDPMWDNAYTYYPARYDKGRRDSALSLRYMNDSAVAVLRIKTFDKHGFKAMGEGSFRSRIHELFLQIATSGAQNLIVDVRDNGGGNPEYARYVVAHLIDSDFVYIDKYKAVNRLHWNEPEQRDHVRWYPYCGIGKFHPDRPCYTGKLYVLMDGGSTSTAGDFVACLSYYKRAVFIGEESGANKTISGGTVTEGTFELPNTHLRCRMSTIQGVNKSNVPNDGHGVIPDYHVVPGPEDYMHHRNPMLEKALELINAKP